MKRATWTAERVLDRIRTLVVEIGDTPTKWEMGPALYEACKRIFGSGTAAVLAAGGVPNRPYTRPGRGRVRAPKSRPVRDPVLALERAESEKRRRAREAAEGMHVPTHFGHMGAVGRSIPKWDDYLPPDDLNTSKRRVR